MPATTSARRVSLGMVGDQTVAAIRPGTRPMPGNLRRFAFDRRLLPTPVAYFAIDVPDGKSGRRRFEQDEFPRPAITREKLAAFGLSARQNRWALATYAAVYLEDNIAVVERDLAAGKVQNLPAYLLAALREDYRPTEMRMTGAALGASETADQAQPTEDHALSIRSTEHLRTQFLAVCLQAALDRLNADEREALERAYVKRLEQGDSFEARLILGLYRKNSMNSKIVESHFRSFAREQLVGVLDEAEFAVYAAVQQGEAGKQPAPALQGSGA